MSLLAALTSAYTYLSHEALMMQPATLMVLLAALMLAALF